MTTAAAPPRIPTGLGRALRLALYLALTVSAVVTMAAMPPIQRRVEAGQLHALWLLAPALCFGVFLCAYIGDRLFQLRYRHYAAGRALFQIIFALLVMFLLLPSSWREYRSVLARKPPTRSLAALMHHSDPRVRAVACELQGFRGDGPNVKANLRERQEDKVPQVRRSATEALLRIQTRKRSLSAGSQPANHSAAMAHPEAPSSPTGEEP